MFFVEVLASILYIVVFSCYIVSDQIWSTPIPVSLQSTIPLIYILNIFVINYHLKTTLVL